ncbi:hypothetical protein Tco_0006232 [Tanacetum coccineum]
MGLECCGEVNEVESDRRGGYEFGGKVVGEMYSVSKTVVGLWFAGGSAVLAGATTGPSADPFNKGKSPLLEEDPPVRERTFRHKAGKTGSFGGRECQYMGLWNRAGVVRHKGSFLDGCGDGSQVHAKSRDLRSISSGQQSPPYSTTSRLPSLITDLPPCPLRKPSPGPLCPSDCLVTKKKRFWAQCGTGTRGISSYDYAQQEAAGVGLVLWGDLKVLMDSPEVNDGSDVWKNQHTWSIQSWKLYSYSGVHVLETVNGLVVHMFVDKKYPLSVNLIERMLDHQLEICHETVGNELTTAVQLIAFLKKQISDSRRPKVHDCPCLDADFLVADSKFMKVDFGDSFKMLLFNPLVCSTKDLSRNLKLTIKDLFGGEICTVMSPGGSIVASFEYVESFFASATPTDLLIATDFEQEGHPRILRKSAKPWGYYQTRRATVMSFVRKCFRDSLSRVYLDEGSQVLDKDDRRLYFLASFFVSDDTHRILGAKGNQPHQSWLASFLAKRYKKFIAEL